VHRGVIVTAAQHDDSASVLPGPQFPDDCWSPHPWKVHVENDEPRHFLARALQGRRAIVGHLYVKPALGQKLFEESGGICAAPYEQDTIGLSAFGRGALLLRFLDRW